MSQSATGRVDGALRVTGRLVALALATAVVFVALGVALKPVFPDGLPPGPEGRRIYLSLLAVALAVAQVVMVALAEKGDWALTGLGSEGWSPWALLSGVGFGLALPALAVLLGMLVGPLVGEPRVGLSWMWPTSSVLVAALVGSLMDVLLFRGYAIGLLAAAWGDLIAVACSAGFATFLVLRLESPTPVIAIDTFMLASCLGILRLRTGSLAAAWLAALTAVVVRDGLGTVPVPGVTAGLLVVVSFLLFRMKAGTSMSNPR